MTMPPTWFHTRQITSSYITCRRPPKVSARLPSQTSQRLSKGTPRESWTKLLTLAARRQKDLGTCAGGRACPISSCRRQLHVALVKSIEDGSILERFQFFYFYFVFLWKMIGQSGKLCQGIHSLEMAEKPSPDYEHRACCECNVGAIFYHHGMMANKR